MVNTNRNDVGSEENPVVRADVRRRAREAAVPRGVSRGIDPFHSPVPRPLRTSEILDECATVIERAKRFLNRCRRIEAMDLIQVDVIGTQPLQAVVDRMHDVLAGQPPVVRVISHRHVDLRRHNDAIAARPEVL